MGKWLWWLYISPFWIYFDLLSAFGTKDTNNLHLTSKNQEKFDSLCDQISRLIVEDINYIDLISQVVNMGQTFAKEMGFQDPNLFIAERRGESVKIGVKEALNENFREKLDLLLKGQHPLTSINGLTYPDGIFYKISPENKLFPELMLSYIVHAPVQIPLTQRHVLNYFGIGEGNTTIFLTPSKDLNKMQNYLFCKWEELVESPIDENFMRELAIFHWYFVQVSPLIQGSEFAAKALVNALLKTKGINLQVNPFRQMEFEVLLEPYIEEFVRNYETYFIKRRS